MENCVAGFAASAGTPPTPIARVLNVNVLVNVLRFICFSRMVPAKAQSRKGQPEFLSWRLCAFAPLRETTQLMFLDTRPKLVRSEEHTSELQSQSNLVCRLLLEKKKKK